MQDNHSNIDTAAIQLPRPTAWPLVLALGVSLIFTGMVTNVVVGILGLLLTLFGTVGWYFQVLPHEAHEAVPVATEEIEIVSTRTLVARVHSQPSGAAPRKVLPMETFRITTGIRGGIAGGMAMIVPATLYSLLKYNSIWYAVNLLAAGGFTSWAGASDAFLSQFHLQGLLAGIAIHGLTSLLVGLLYGAMLPMFPRYPIVTAGIMVPLIFTGIMHSTLGIVSPILDQRIDWLWFVVSQLAFGLVCGFVVNLQARVRTPQFQALPFAVRAGLHMGAGDPTHDQAKTTHEEDRRK